MVCALHPIDNPVGNYRQVLIHMLIVLEVTRGQIKMHEQLVMPPCDYRFRRPAPLTLSTARRGCARFRLAEFPLAASFEPLSV